MTIQEIINNRYKDLHSMLKDTDKTVYDSVTFEDLLHDVLIASMKKYKDEDFTEKEGFEALKKALLTEILFSKKRKKNIGLINYVSDLKEDNERQEYY